MNRHIFAMRPEAACCPPFRLARPRPTVVWNRAPPAPSDRLIRITPPAALADASGRWLRHRTRILRSRIRGLTGFSAALLIGLCAIVSPAQAQLHEAEKAGYVVRASVANAQMLSPEALAKHKLRAAPLLVNVMVLKRGQPIESGAVAAEVHVDTTDLLGSTSRVDMREVRENQGISYLGTFDFPLNGLELDFHVRARPVGANAEIELRFRESLPRPAR